MKRSLLLILAGVAAGILLAPRKGSETWEMILDKIDELKADAMDEAEDVRESAVDLGETAAGKSQ